MKKKAVLIYNPKSGEALFKDQLDTVIDNIQNDHNGNGDGYYVDVFRICSYNDVFDYLKDKKDIDVVIGAGGDGTINSIITAMQMYNIDAPIAIVSSGTANDFASSLHLPKDPIELVQLIHKNNIKKADLGMVNGKYFINVTAVGLYANISSEVDQEFKNTFGKLAYYVKGVEKSLEKITKKLDFRVRITTSKEVYEDSFILMTILNTSNAGGFKKLSPDSNVSDGLFEFIGFKDTSTIQSIRSFFETIVGNHINNPNVLFFKDNYIKIEVLGENNQPVHCDIDGELGPVLPIEINVLPGKIKYFSTI